MRTTRRLAAGTALATLALAGSLAITQPFAGAHDGPHGEPPASTSPELSPAQRQVIREATRQFVDVDAALAAGYVPGGECAEAPGLGAMGIHYVHPALIADGRVDPTTPEILLYAPTKQGGLELVGVEYMTVAADQVLEDGADTADRPTLMGHAFEGPMPGHEPGMPVHYDLHAWVFATNPAGSLATWNPALSC